MSYEEYKEKIKTIFNKYCLQELNSQERDKYINSADSEKTIKECYSADKYSKDNFEGFEGVFSDESILSRTCRTLEKLY